MNTTKRAVGLLSGGLDSTLAILLMKEQGIDVHVVHFAGPWGCDEEAYQRAADQLGITVKILQKGEEYIDLVRNPKFGYGRNMNPCIDCRAYMFKRAKPYMEEVGASFLFTGEVLGQRPMSQTLGSMKKIDREADMEGWILRPLSAQWLEPTIPEKLGIVDRGKLLDVQGRTRKTQMEWARKYAITYPSPAGGCLLTQKEFTPKLQDLFQHEERPSMTDARLLRYGRHFRVRPDLKLVVGRNAEENAKMEALARQGNRYTLIQPADFKGPTALADGPLAGEDAQLAASLVVHYSKAAPGARVRVGKETVAAGTLPFGWIEEHKLGTASPVPV
jgi:tRNA U34 2-thiouridine synthase MnmA/TrmU